MTANGRLYGAVEAGGTKFVCGIGSGPDDLDELAVIPTADPETTLAAVVDYFRGRRRAGAALAGIGVGAFGPLDLDPRSPGYGRLTVTPKDGWRGADLLGPLADGLDLPVAIDTDVNAAALGEQAWGAARNLADFLYCTVGTGIGVGAFAGGRLLAGVQHPEMGHVSVPLAPAEPHGFRGVCPFHGACIEGLASGRAIAARWGSRLDALPPAHAAWQLEADYLATFFASLTFVLQPSRIIVGGGVASEALLERTRPALRRALGGYRPALDDDGALAGFLVSPGLGDRSGVLGALALAREIRLETSRRG